MTLGRGEGPSTARIMIVGEAWGETELLKQRPFVGASGAELDSMLGDAGISRSECFVTNLVNARPQYNRIDSWIPKKKKDITAKHVQFRNRFVDPIIVEGFEALKHEIALVEPNIIIALGGSALWALTGAEGILKWRGSQLYTMADGVKRTKLLPTIHPAAILREYAYRPAAVRDLKRAARERMNPHEYQNVPDWRFAVRPSFERAKGQLEALLDLAQNAHSPLWLDFDLETRAGHIACAGISWSIAEAICIPFMCVERREGYWTREEEAALVYLLYRLLTHPKVRVRGQNLLYDCQYTNRHWCFIPRVAQDTMITQHSVFCGLKKSLDFQASMYCDHYVYWKDDGKTWNKDVGEDQLWRYNAEDCVRTREVGEVGARNVERLGLQSVEAFQQEFFWPVLQCMIRGVRIDQKLRQQMALLLYDEIAAREAWLNSALGHSLNPRSIVQMRALFYSDLGCKPNWSKPKPGQPRTLTCDDKALEKISHEQPLLRPIITRIQELRSLGVFLSTFVNAPLDVDGRMRTSYNICGAETFRFSSSENAFGSGTNLQNIPKGGEDDDSGLVLPNVRKLFVPDDGFIIFDTDLSKADLRIVVWEAGETEMKAMLKEGRDPYVETAREFHKDPSLKKTRSDGSEDPRYRIFKSFCHGTHYLGTPRGLAQRLGLTVHQAERTQKWYLGKYPRIAKWQEDFKRQVASRKYVQNVFGYRRYYFDRVDESMFREAIAWVPQSTVALYINRIWMNIFKQHPHIQILLQVHDSLVGQFPSHRQDECLAQIRACGDIVLPYEDPCVIPMGIKWSHKSWGDCE